MNRETLQHQANLSEIALDNLLNQLKFDPKWELQIDLLSDEIDDELADFIIANSKPKQLKPGHKGTSKKAKTQPIEDNSQIRSMSIDEAALDAMGDEAIDSQRATTEQYQANSQGMQSGLLREALQQRRVEGLSAGELQAIEYVNGVQEGFQSVLERYSDHQYNSHLSFLQNTYDTGKSHSAQTSEERVKRMNERSEKMAKTHQNLLGKFNR